jgi:WD40 repeat protein
LIQLCIDGQELVTRFFDVIAKNGAYIYHSVLPFIPPCTLQNTYKSDIPPSVPAIRFPTIGYPVFKPPLWNQYPKLLYSPERYVESVSFMPDSRHLVSAVDSVISIWDIQSCSIVNKLPDHTYGVLAFAVSLDGKHIVSGSNDETVHVWEFPSGKVLQKLIGHSHGVYCVAISQDGQWIASGSFDNTIRIWNLPNGEHQFTLEGHTSFVLSVTFSNDGSLVVSGSDDCTVRIWNTSDGTLVHALHGHTHRVCSVVFIASQNRVILSQL